MAEDTKARPSEEIKSVNRFYVSEPDLNVTIQVGGLRLGPIASHIVTSYWRFKEKLERDKKLEDDETRFYSAFKLFTEKKLPLIAAQFGDNVTDEFIAAYIATTKSTVILASGMKADYSSLIKDATTPTDPQQDSNKK